MSPGPDASEPDTIPRSRRFRPGGSRARIADAAPVQAEAPRAEPPPGPPMLAFTPAAEARGTDQDVVLGYQIFLGRDPENSFVIANARTSPVHAMVQGWITSEEFLGAVLGPLESGHALPHERASPGPDATQTAWLLRHLELNPIGRAAVGDASTWRDLLHVLVGLPGFPRPHARSPAAAGGGSAEASPNFILITIDKPEAGDLLDAARIEGSGWVIAPSDITAITIHAGDTLLTEARFGLPRPDVARRFPHYRQVDRCGFAFEAEAPPAGLGSGGAALLTVSVRTADGTEARKGVRVRVPDPESGSARVRHPTPAAAPEPGARDEARDASEMAAFPVRLFVEMPAVEGDAARLSAHEALAVSGWALTHTGMAKITVSCDGETLGLAHGGVRREDVASVFPAYPEAQLAGWTLVIPPGSLTAGQHELRVVAESAAGERAEQSIPLIIQAGSVPPSTLVRRSMPAAEAAFDQRLLARQPVRLQFAVLVTCAPNAPAAALEATLDTLERQVFPGWRATLVFATKRALAEAEGLPAVVRLKHRLRLETAASLAREAPAPVSDGRQDMLMRLRAGDMLGCDALLKFAVAAAANPAAGMLFADDVRIDPAASIAQPYYKPAFAPEMLLGVNYIGRAWCARSDLCAEAGLPAAALAVAADYDAALRLSEAAGHVAHVPYELMEQAAAGDTTAEAAAALQAAMTRRSETAEVLAGPVPGLWHVRRLVAGVECVSVIMPTCGARGLVRRAITSLRETLAREPDAPPVEIIVIDDLPATDQRTRTWLRKHADVLVKADTPFNWSRYNNQGVAASRGDVLLFLNDDIEMTAPGWLKPMLEQVQRPRVGAVGPKLLYPDGRVQHAGFYLADGLGRHAFRFAEASETGPFGIAAVAREVIGVTGACLMVRRELFKQVGGFDEAHSVINNDLDFCLRVRAAGHENIYTPHACMLHHELASRGAIPDSFDRGKFLASNRLAFAAGDPYRSPMLGAASDQYGVEHEPAEVVHAGKAGSAGAGVRNILALKLDHIGDFVTAFPALRVLKARFPQARLTVMAAPASQALANLEPAIDDMLEFSFFHARSDRGLRIVPEQELQALRAQLAGRQFDLAIDLRMQPQTRALLRATGARVLAGYDHDGSFPWLDVALEWEGDHRLRRKRAPIVERLVQLAEAAAAAFDRPAPPAAAPSGVSAEEVLALLPAGFAGRRLVCVHPGVGNPVRRWPATSFAALIDLLVADDGCAVVLIGSPDETAVADEVLRLVALGAPVRSLAGTLPLADLPVLLRACALFVGNNSGPQHVAARLGVPTVGVHSGVVDAREWAPAGELAVAIQRRMTCGPCYYEFAHQCPRELACLTGLRPRDVHAVCRQLLSAGAAAGHAPADDQDLDAAGVAHRAATEILEPPAEGLQGYVETLSCDGTGSVWMIGWIKAGHPLDFPAVISELRTDSKPYAAEFSSMTFKRADLPEDAFGIVGLARCDWRPTTPPGGGPIDFCLFFGQFNRFHLRCHRPLRVINGKELAGEYRGLVQRELVLLQSPTLLRLLGPAENWQPTRQGPAWLGTEVSVDRILLVPGLGCFVEGWVLSPLRRVETLRLRIGDVVLPLRPHSLTWKARLDLVAAYPASEAMAARAGFVGLFESGMEPADFAEALLKIVFEGSASVNWPIPPKVFRRLGQSGRIEDARVFFPALEDEPFFPAFAEAAAKAERAMAAPPVPLQVAGAEAVIIFVLPQERCDLFLLFEQAARHCRAWLPSSPLGVAFVSSAGPTRPDALWLFREFVRDVPDVPASLLTISEPGHAFTLLPTILVALGAQRFALVADGVFLADRGWAEVVKSLQTDATGLVFYDDAAGALGARCFSWTAAQFTPWAADTAPFLGGFYRDNRLPKEPRATVPDAAWASRPVVRSRLQDAVNRALAGEAP